MGLVWIPQGCVTERGWPVNLPLIPFNPIHSHSYAALKYDSCNLGTGLGTYFITRGRVMHILDFGTHFFTAIAACSLHAWPQAFTDVLTLKQSSSYVLLHWPCLCSMLFKGISCYRNPVGFPVAASPLEIKDNTWEGLKLLKKASTEKKFQLEGTR